VKVAGRSRPPPPAPRPTQHATRNTQHATRNTPFAPYVDDSFSHEFGVEKCGHDEIETIYPIELCDRDDPRLFVLDELAREGCTRNRRTKKRARQWLRKIDHELAALDPERFWPYDKLYHALN
jgi:hypothetical protein